MPSGLRVTLVTTRARRSMQMNSRDVTDRNMTTA